MKPLLAALTLAAMFWVLFGLSADEYGRFSDCLARGGSTESCEGR